jgi:hypothetical protein
MIDKELFFGVCDNPDCRCHIDPYKRFAISKEYLPAQCNVCGALIEWFDETEFDDYLEDQWKDQYHE